MVPLHFMGNKAHFVPLIHPRKYNIASNEIGTNEVTLSKKYFINLQPLLTQGFYNLTT